MIRLDNITKVYSSRTTAAVTALEDINLEIAPGEFVIITGRSGSGKTTLLNVAAGLTRPSSGKVYWEPVDLWQLPDKEQSRLRNRQVGFIFQFPSLLPSLTVLENVLLPVIFDAGHTSSAGNHARAKELLEMVGLSDKLSAYPRQLSAGQGQRVVIARALLKQPKFLLADEPTSNLDEQTELEIMQLFQHIHAENRLTVVLVTHTSQLVRYGTRALQMSGGKVR